MKSTKIILYMVRLVAIGVGLPLILVSIFAFYKAWSSQEWHSAPGVITKVEKKRAARTYVDLKVTYQAGGKAFECRRIGFATTQSGQSGYYKANSSAPVFYNPNEPEDCVLDRGLSIVIIEFVLGLFFLLIGVDTFRKIKVTTLAELQIPATIARAQKLADSGKVARAVKVYRRATGARLKEAENFIQDYLSNKK
jgi:hypothetical protein